MLNSAVKSSQQPNEPLVQIHSHSVSSQSIKPSPSLSKPSVQAPGLSSGLGGVPTIIVLIVGVAIQGPSPINVTVYSPFLR